MNDRTKLPKWAQDAIFSLEYRITELEAALSERAYEPRYEGDEPRVFLRQNVGNEWREKALGGNYTTVIFRTPTDEVELKVSDRGGQLAIRADARDIAIHPEARNVVRLTGKGF